MTDPSPVSNDVSAFADLVTEYCSFIEDSVHSNSITLLVRAQELLPRLYAAALRLPDVWNPPPASPEDEAVADELPDDAEYDPGASTPDPDAPTSEQSTEMRNRLGERLTDVRYYSLVFAPYDIDNPDPVRGDLSDDLIDTYIDLQRGLAKHRRGDVQSAAWEWQFNFAAHWGRHALDATRALHALAFDKDMRANLEPQ